MIPKEWLQYAPKPKPVSKDEVWNVFLSYRSVNRAWVLGLYDVLTELGHKVFFDQYVLKAGDNLSGSLYDGLNRSQAGVLIWSAANLDLERFGKEYYNLERKAIDNKKFIFIPVKIDNSPLPTFADNRIFFDFSSYPDGPAGGDLLRLLYAIAGIPLTDEALHFANAQDEETIDTIAQINAAIRNGRDQKLVQLFEKGGLPWETSAFLGCKAAEGLTKIGNKDAAITMLDVIEKKFPKAIRPKQLKALALARRGKEGDLEEAQDILGILYAKNNLDPETMGLYGRTWMDRYRKSNDINDLIQSRDLYAEAFEKSPDDYYTGINAASKSVFIGTDEALEKAAGYAARVENLVGTEAVPGDYWKTATIGEVLLIQKKYREAGEMYKKAVAMARSQTDSQQSTWKQADLLMQKMHTGPDDRLIIASAFKHLGIYNNDETEDFDSVDAFIKSGEEYEALGEYDSALEIYSRAYDRFPEEFEFLRKKSDLYNKKGDVNQYLEYLRLYNQEKNKNTLKRNLQHKIVIKTFEIESHAFYGNLKWPANSKINILLGKNGYGKSHLLSIILGLLQNDIAKTKEYSSSNAQLSLSLESDISFSLTKEQHIELDAVTEADIRKEIEEDMLERNQMIIFSRKGLENFYGKVPVLAIPDLRFIDKSTDVLTRPKDNIDLLTESAIHFLYQKSYSTVIENALLRVCQIYFERTDKKKPLAIFDIMEKTFYKLTGGNFTIKNIESKLNTGYEIQVSTEGSERLPIQKVSQGTFSVLSIILVIYNYLRARYPTVNEDQILFQNAIVFIDEIDAHLHPSWQQKIINILRETFPEIQFFITGHSPLIVAGCRTEEVAVLRKAESGFKLEFFENDFIGFQPHELYKMIFEMEEYDETYLKYNSLLPFKESFEKEIEELKNVKELTEDNKKRLDELFTDLYYIDIVAKKAKERSSA